MVEETHNETPAMDNACMYFENWSTLLRIRKSLGFLLLPEEPFRIVISPSTALMCINGICPLGYSHNASSEAGKTMFDKLALFSSKKHQGQIFLILLLVKGAYLKQAYKFDILQKNSRAKKLITQGKNSRI